MSGNTKQTIPFAQEQLTQAIAKLKQGSREDVVPTLEVVLAQLQALSTHDHLTGALNRRTVLASLDFELQRSMRTGHTFTLAVISVDHLPEILGQHGQDAAKQVLQEVTREAIKVLRTLDSFGRITATEFAIVMPTTWLDQSLKAINRLKRGLQALDWQAIAPDYSISFCTGLTANSPGDSTDAMLERALQALQKAKEKGSDQVAQIELDLPDFDLSALMP